MQDLYRPTSPSALSVKLITEPRTENTLIGPPRMISRFFHRYYRWIIFFVVLTFPLLWWQAESIPTNNDIETWLPRNTEVRQEYERFKRDFGAEEILVIGLQQDVDPHLIEPLARRLERLDELKIVWTPTRLRSTMMHLGVPEEEAQQRLTHLLLSPTGAMQGLVASMSEAGSRNRASTVNKVRKALEFCGLSSNQVALNGAPVIVTELDKMGSQRANRGFFLITLAISLTLLYLSFGHSGMALSTLGVTLWGIYLTQAMLRWCGGEMNFILGSLSVMVMIFTLSIAVHLVSYYSEARRTGAPDPLSVAFQEAWRPCALSTLTTLLGLVSLNVSDILPVAQFGYAAALGSIVALVVGMGVVPALLLIWPDCQTRSLCFHLDYGLWGTWVARHKREIILTATALVIVTGLGLLRLQSDLDPIEFLPRNSYVLRDLKTIEKELTGIDSLEAVVDFGYSDLPFLRKLEKVRQLEQRIAQHPGVRHVMSAATFFPTELPDSPFFAARLLARAQEMCGQEGWIVGDQRKWRISARLYRDRTNSPVKILNDLQQSLAGEPVTFTGLTPLLKSAQQEIFKGFWESFTAACLTISLVMIISLRSLPAAIIAMIPNIIPIWLVFGSLGFFGAPVDIGMMMTGSIALGISVDCTFHFLVQYRDAYRNGCSSVEACRRALMHCGEPMLESTLICSLGLLALCLSQFVPTARFGALMAAQMLASLLGEMLILPALLCCRPCKREVEASAYEVHPEPLLACTMTPTYDAVTYQESAA